MRAGLLLVVLLLAGCAAPGLVDEPVPGVAEGVVPYASWKETLSVERFTDIVSAQSHLTAPDGTTLAVTVWRPADAGDEKLPTLLQITPYQSLDRPFYTLAEGPEFWPRRGVAFAEADARGTHSSGGCLDFGGAKDREDAVAFAEWTRAQPWSDGRILVEGVSHPGMGVLVAAVARAPGLVGGLAHAPVSSYYMDEWMNGAKFDSQFNGPAYQAIETLPTLDPTPEALVGQAGGTCQGQTTLQFTAGDGSMSPWFEDKDLNLLAADVEAPLLLTIGFVDMNVFPTHVEAFWKAMRPDADRRLVYGYWTHGYPDFDGYRIPDYAEYQQRWLDTALLGVESGLAAEPRVVVEDSRGDWHELDAWPPAGAALTRYWPTPEGALATEAPADGEASWVDDPRALRDRWGADAHVIFETEAFAEDRWIAGAPNVTLVAASSADATKYVVYLFDVAPDGSRLRVTHGYIDSRFPDGLAAPAPPPAGTPATYAFELFPTAHVVEAGHRLALVLASTDTPPPDGSGYTTCPELPQGGCYDPSGIQPSANPMAENVARLGAEGTRLVVPIADPEEGLVPA